MIKVVPTLTLALFAAVSFSAHAASHSGAPMKAEAASAPASGAMMKKEEKAAADKAHAKEMKSDSKDKKMDEKKDAKK